MPGPPKAGAGHIRFSSFDTSIAFSIPFPAYAIELAVLGSSRRAIRSDITGPSAFRTS
jgi:hypothetical protein